MSLFKKIFKTKKIKEKKVLNIAPARKIDEKVNYLDVILSPRITEKASEVSSKNVWIFNVRKDSNKIKIKEAVTALYNVIPEKICISKIASKSKRIKVKGRERETSKTKQGKKAYVYLKKGDKIDLK